MEILILVFYLFIFQRLLAHLYLIKFIQKINHWKEIIVGGYEVYIRDYTKRYEVNQQIKKNYTSFDIESRTIDEIYPSIFAWLDIQNVNRNVLPDLDLA
jgi:lipoprotein-releasing system permease protein